MQSLLITCTKLGGKGIKTNAKTAFKSEHLRAQRNKQLPYMEPLYGGSK